MAWGRVLLRLYQSSASVTSMDGGPYSINRYQSDGNTIVSPCTQVSHAVESRCSEYPELRQAASANSTALIVSSWVKHVAHWGLLRLAWPSDEHLTRANPSLSRRRAVMSTRQSCRSSIDFGQNRA